MSDSDELENKTDHRREESEGEEFKKERKDESIVFTSLRDVSHFEKIRLKSQYYTGIVVRVKELQPVNVDQILRAIENDYNKSIAVEDETASNKDGSKGEEKKDEVENVEDFDAPTGKFSGLSASRKIAEMGLGRVNSTPDKMNPSATKAVTGAEDQVKHSAFNRILSEGPVDKAA